MVGGNERIVVWGDSFDSEEDPEQLCSSHGKDKVAGGA